MSDTDLDTDPDQQHEQQQQKDSRDFAKVRKQLTDVTSERDTLRRQLLDNAISGAGYDPELGIVQRLAKEFDGDLTAEAFKSFATAEGLNPAATTEQTTTEGQQQNETVNQLNTLQGQGDKLRQLSTITEPNNADATARKLLDEGSIGQLLDHVVFDKPA